MRRLSLLAALMLGLVQGVQAKMSTNVPEALIRAVGSRLDSEVEHWWVRDLTDSYHWLRGARIYWVIGSEFGSAVASSDAPDRFVCLSCPGGLSAVSRQIAENLGSAPWSVLGVDGFARLIVEWTEDPRVRVADLAFLTSQSAVMETWLLGREKSEAVFAGACVDPTLSQTSEGRFELRFNAIDHAGAVKRLIVGLRQNPFEIEKIDVEIIHPEGTFSYPDEL